MSIIWRTKGVAHVLGDDIVHDGQILPVAVVGSRVTDPEILATHLFEGNPSGLRDRLRSGDFIVAGKNFGSGKPHTGGYIGMRALGLRVLCESMPLAVTRAVMNLALPCMPFCMGITSHVRDGDEIEVDFETGTVTNLNSGESLSYTPVPLRVRELIEQGGLRGSLADYLDRHPELSLPPK